MSLFADIDGQARTADPDLRGADAETAGEWLDQIQLRDLASYQAALEIVSHPVPTVGKWTTARRVTTRGSTTSAPVTPASPPVLPTRTVPVSKPNPDR